MFLLPAAAALIAVVFAVGCWRSARGGAALRVWALALAMFAIAAAALGWGAAFGWTTGLFRTYYVFGAVLNVPWLGLGTVWLLASRKVAAAATVVVAVASMAAVAIVIGADLLPGAASALQERTVVSGAAVFPVAVRDLSRIYSFVGLIVLVGGLAWSLLRRRGQAVGLGLLLAGSLIIFAVSVYARRGELGPFSVGLTLGVSVMYAGFLATRRGGRVRAENLRRG